MQNWFPITIFQSKFFQNRCLQTQIPNLCFFSTKVFQNTMSNLTKSYLTAKTTKQGQFGSSAKAPNTGFSQGENTKHTKHWVQHLHYDLPSCLLEEWKKGSSAKTIHRFLHTCTLLVLWNQCPIATHTLTSRERLRDRDLSRFLFALSNIWPHAKHMRLFTSVFSSSCIFACRLLCSSHVFLISRLLASLLILSSFTSLL